MIIVKGLKSKIWVNQKLKYRYKISITNIVKILLNFHTKEELQTLNHIYLIYQLKDFDYIAKHNNEELPDYQTFWTDEVGLMWFAKQNVFINMRFIEKFAKEFSLSADEFNKEFSLYGFYCTLFHELRHLTLDTNIFLSEEAFPIVESSEELVEKYSQNTTELLKYSNFDYIFSPQQICYF